MPFNIESELKVCKILTSNSFNELVNMWILWWLPFSFVKTTISPRTKNVLHCIRPMSWKFMSHLSLQTCSTNVLLSVLWKKQNKSGQKHYLSIGFNFVNSIICLLDNILLDWDAMYLKKYVKRYCSWFMNIQWYNELSSLL